MAGYTEEEYEQSQGATTATPPKGSVDWAGQNSGSNAPGLTPTPGISPKPSADAEHQTSTLSPEQQQRIDATAGTDRQIKTIQDWMDAEGNRPETEEERKKRERREKSKRIIAAVSDGLSALSNLYFTSQYAPNMYNHEKGSMTHAVNTRLDRIKAEREKKRDQYLNFSLKLGDLQNQRAATLRELEAQQERQKLAREKAQREDEEHGWNAALQPDKQREQAGKADKAEQQALSAKYEAENKPESLLLDNEYKKAGIAQRKAATETSHAQTGYYNNGGSAGVKKHHFRGKEYVSEKDYTKDVTEAARQYNERHMEEVEVDDGNGGRKRQRQYKPGFEPIVIDREERIGTGKRIVARKPEEYAGEVERRLAEEEQASRGKKKTNVNWK